MDEALTRAQELLSRWDDELARILKDLESRYPGVTKNVLADGGGLHRFINVYVNDEDVRYLGSLETPIADGDVVSILPAVAGGA